MIDILRVFMGWDANETQAYDVARYSITRRSSKPVCVEPLKQEALRWMGLYRRAPELGDDGRLIDNRDGKPFSTEFSFTRFLVPALMQYRGWALFLDPDVLLQADIAKLFNLANDRYAVMCVKHDHRPDEKTKMLNHVQTRYRRKNWSSVMLFNCAHPANRALTPERVSNETGTWLHGFHWLDGIQIGGLPEAWNWLEGHSDAAIEPKLIHYTRGGPWWDEWKDVAHADKWLAERDAMKTGEYA